MLEPDYIDDGKESGLRRETPERLLGGKPYLWKKRNMKLWYRSIVRAGESLRHESSFTPAALCALWKEHPSVVTNLITTYYDVGSHCRGYVTVECMSNACR